MCRFAKRCEDPALIERSEDVSIEAWSWSAAQARLSQAYDNGGFQGWAEAALQELEAEAEIERRKRGLDR